MNQCDGDWPFLPNMGVKTSNSTPIYTNCMHRRHTPLAMFWRAIACSLVVIARVGRPARIPEHSTESIAKLSRLTRRFSWQCSQIPVAP
jgi:hypothetical protein